MDKFWVCHDHNLDRILKCEFGKDTMKADLYEYFMEVLVEELKVEQHAFLSAKIDELEEEVFTLSAKLEKKEELIREIKKKLAPSLV